MSERNASERAMGVRERRCSGVGVDHSNDRGTRDRHLGSRGPGTQQRVRAGHRAGHRLLDDTGSAVAEFTLVGALLTLLALSVLQLALALHVRNTVIDAASEGARFAALADSSPAAGVQRSRDLIETALGPAYAADISVKESTIDGVPTIELRVRSALPLFGLVGTENSIDVSGHARKELIR